MKNNIWLLGLSWSLCFELRSKCYLLNVRWSSWATTTTIIFSAYIVSIQAPLDGRTSAVIQCLHQLNVTVSLNETVFLSGEHLYFKMNQLEKLMLHDSTLWLLMLSDTLFYFPAVCLLLQTADLKTSHIQSMATFIHKLLFIQLVKISKALMLKHLLCLEHYQEILKIQLLLWGVSHVNTWMNLWLNRFLATQVGQDGSYITITWFQVQATLLLLVFVSPGS